MGTRQWAALLAFLVAIGFLIRPSWTPAQEKAHALTKWEYKIVKIEAAWGSLPRGPSDRYVATVPGIISEKELKTLGGEGWELFRITDAQLSKESFTATVYYFKRPK